jgi:hypothetical protein
MPIEPAGLISPNGELFLMTLGEGVELKLPAGWKYPVWDESARAMSYETWSAAERARIQVALSIVRDPYAPYGAVCAD